MATMICFSQRAHVPVFTTTDCKFLQFYTQIKFQPRLMSFLILLDKWGIQ